MSASVQPTHGRRVAILLATYNGAAYLREQLASIAAQTHANWELHVSDDHSSDATLEILAEFSARVGAERLHMYTGPGKGFVANYLFLAHCPAKADYYAFCDQDDLWLPGKLERALAWLERPSQGAHQASMYGSRTVLMDPEGAFLGLSARWRKPLSVRNALVQSFAGGNTIVFNTAARDLLRAAGKDVAAASHDWWLYLLVSAVGGTVSYDPVPWLCYRQHASNLQGSNRGLARRLHRLKELLGGRMQSWNEAHCRALQNLSELITPEGRKALQEFRRMRAAGGFEAVQRFRRSGCYRQNGLDDLALMLAAALRRL